MRSRWQRLEERRDTLRAIKLLVVTFFIIGGLVFFGFKGLAQLFIFMGDVKSANKPIEKSDSIPPSPPLFITRMEATNSATLSLEGEAEAGSTIFLTKNKQSEASTVCSNGGMFEFTNITLDQGVNTFSAVAVDNASNRSQVSTTLTINYSAKPPDLFIETPFNGQKVTGGDPKLTISGSTNSGKAVVINERVVIVSPSGKFNYQITLNVGENIVIIKVTDKFGNQTQKELKVTYQP